MADSAAVRHRGPRAGHLRPRARPTCSRPARAPARRRVLVDRYVRCVLDPDLGAGDVRAVAAITFTEKAAGELRQRIREELERLDAAADPGSEEAARLRVGARRPGRRPHRHHPRVRRPPAARVPRRGGRRPGVRAARRPRLGPRTRASVAGVAHGAGGGRVRRGGRSARLGQEAPAGGRAPRSPARARDRQGRPVRRALRHRPCGGGGLRAGRRRRPRPSLRSGWRPARVLRHGLRRPVRRRAPGRAQARATPATRCSAMCPPTSTSSWPGSIASPFTEKQGGLGGRKDNWSDAHGGKDGLWEQYQAVTREVEALREAYAELPHGAGRRRGRHVLAMGRGEADRARPSRLHRPARPPARSALRPTWMRGCCCSVGSATCSWTSSRTPIPSRRRSSSSCASASRWRTTGGRWCWSPASSSWSATPSSPSTASAAPTSPCTTRSRTWWSGSRADTGRVEAISQNFRTTPGCAWLGQQRVRGPVRRRAGEGPAAGLPVGRAVSPRRPRARG